MTTSELRHRPRRITGVVLMTAGSFLALPGFLGMFVYITTAIESIGQADRSLLFWYFPFLAIGAMMAVAGVALILRGRKAMQQLRDLEKAKP